MKAECLRVLEKRASLLRESLSRARRRSEIEAATAAIESKTERSGQVAVEVVQTVRAA